MSKGRKNTHFPNGREMMPDFQDDDIAPHDKSFDPGPVKFHSILTPEEFMHMGLDVFYKKRRKLRCRPITNQRRFQKFYGVAPAIAAQVWTDLQKTTLDKDVKDPWGERMLPVPPNRLNPKHFLMALHHLKRYPTDDEREGVWDLSPKTNREWVRFFLLRIQALKKLKIRFPEADEWGDDIWIITVDGTHCWIFEPRHPEWSQDSKYFSHKHGKAGVSYELGIAIASSRLVWMNGPFKAGTNDVTIFKDHGLRALLERIGKKGIGDRAYTGYQHIMSTFNRFDGRGVRKFKSRALHRHETFNFRTKRYMCLRGPFRHGVESFAMHFEAVCVLCQYQIEYDEPLFDVLIEDIMLNN